MTFVKHLPVKEVLDYDLYNVFIFVCLFVSASTVSISVFMLAAYGYITLDGYVVHPNVSQWVKLKIS